MKKRWKIAAAFVAIAISCPAAGAGDLKVAYRVEEKPLKSSAAGNMLTFDLYADSSCTTLVATYPVPIDDVTFSRLKLFTPPGGTKPPKTAVLESTVAAPAAASYLKVTGTGIVAVGSDCQAQSAGTSGKTVAVSTLSGASGVLNLASGTWTFVGPTATLQLTAAQIVTATAEFTMDAPSPVVVGYSICSQPNAGGPLTTFAAGPVTAAEVGGSSSAGPFTAVGATAPGAGVWKFGYCLLSSSPETVNGGIVNGWVTVAQ